MKTALALLAVAGIAYALTARALRRKPPVWKFITTEGAVAR